MERIPEPAVKDSRIQARVYAKTVFSDSDSLYVSGLISSYPSCLTRVVDIGTGPGHVMRRLAEANPRVEITAIDSSEFMVREAQDMARERTLDSRIQFIQGYFPCQGIELGDYHAVLSKDLLHHLEDPSTVWRYIKENAEKGTLLYFMDLFRPASERKAREIVRAVAPDADRLMKDDFYHSLLAAYTPDEVREQLVCAGLRLEVKKVGPRHMLIEGLII